MKKHDVQSVSVMGVCGRSRGERGAVSRASCRDFQLHYENKTVESLLLSSTLVSWIFFSFCFCLFLKSKKRKEKENVSNSIPVLMEFFSLFFSCCVFEHFTNSSLHVQLFKEKKRKQKSFSFKKTKTVSDTVTVCFYNVQDH